MERAGKFDSIYRPRDIEYSSSKQDESAIRNTIQYSKLLQ